jgi:hypothetical protein
MRGYGQYCPIALAAEVFAERWTPIIIRNLHLGCERFTAILDGAPGLGRSMLSQRLRSLERAGVVTHDGDRWTLTASGVSSPRCAWQWARGVRAGGRRGPRTRTRIWRCGCWPG